MSGCGGSGDAATWHDVAAPGTDPDRLAVVVALACTAPGRALLRSDGPAAAASSRTTPAARRAADEARDVWATRGVRVSLPGDPAWPLRFDRLAGPPWWSAARGTPPDDAVPAVAVVGARRATGYGTGVAAWLAEAAAAAGAVVVSGGARGIDAAAHEAAADAATVVVLGCGHDVDYPRPHARPGGLFERVVDGGGCLLSEHLPGTEPRPGVVRGRNRLVAALADVVVVVEGGPRSGSLVTAGAAAELGVQVMAVPGDVRAPGSVAPHRLLAEGAAPCTRPGDLLDVLRATRPTTLPATGGGGAADDPVVGGTVLPAALHAELARRWPRAVHVGDLAAATATTVGAVLAAVTRGLVAGELAESPDGVRFRRAPGAPGDRG